MQQTHHRDISRYDEAFLLKTLAKRLAFGDSTSTSSYVDHLAGSTEEAEHFYSLLHIPYSEFFRNQLSFALLEQWILPTLMSNINKSGQGELRVWSAGCAAGQEIYSIAILLEEMSESAENHVGARLFATDYSNKELALAQQGVYDNAAVRNVRQRHIRKYFNAEDESYKIIGRIKDRVNFSTYDLLDDRSSSPAASVYGDFDLVFCSNLLFYYRPEIRKSILSRIYQSLSPNGFLVTGEAERELVSKQEGFRAVAPPSAIFQKTMYRGIS